MDIRTDIPLPPARHEAGRNPIYPFEKMPVGGSFGVPHDVAIKVADAARKWKARHPGWNYASRKLETETRFWRTS